MFKFESTLDVDGFKKTVAEVAEKRVCLVTGAQIYGVFLYGGMYGSFGLQRAGMPDLIDDNDRLSDQIIAHMKSLETDIDEFVEWLKFLKVDETLKNTAINWFTKSFPFIANSPEARLVSEKLLADFRYIVDCSEGNEKKIMQQVCEFIQRIYTVAQCVTYVYHNFKDENDLCYPDPSNTDRFIPKGGKMVKLLYCILPKTRRAAEMTTFVLQPELAPFVSNAVFDSHEGDVINYYDKQGNVVETGLIDIIVDSLLS